METELHLSFGDAVRGVGRAVYIEGGPGAGRTSLLAAGAEIGLRAGTGVLSATARLTEQGFRFGIALQLFEAGNAEAEAETPSFDTGAWR